MPSKHATRLLLFAAIATLTNESGAAEPARNAVNLFQRTQEKVMLLSGPGSGPCFTCGVIANEEPGQAPVCEDLFGAACLKPDGTPKNSALEQQRGEALRRPLLDIQENTARKMGFAGLDEAFRAKLAAAGLEVLPDPDPAAWQGLKREIGSSQATMGIADRVFASVAACAKEADALAQPLGKEESLESLRERLGKIEAFQENYRDRSIKLYARDVPNFFSNRIVDKCDSLRLNPDNYPPERNPEITKACANLAGLKRQAINLFRQEGTGLHLANAEKFVKENWLPSPRFAEPAATHQPPEAERLRLEIERTAYNLRSTCQTFGSLAENVGGKVVQDFLLSVNTARPTVEGVIDSVYGDARKKAATRALEEARADVTAIVGSFVTDPAKRKNILAGYETLGLYWMQKPPAAAYKEGPGGVPVLDENKAVLTALRPFTDDPYATFSDPTLSFFTSVNADYLPRIAIGNLEKKERVSMMPYFLALAETAPHSFFTVLAHEVGHRIGPQVSRLNGFDLHAEYAELLSCYRGEKSLNLQPGQEDEVIADYISSEVLARQLARLPAAERGAALVASVGDLCSSGNEQGSVECRGNHPESSLRLNGIYAANPNLRKAVGCEGASTDFRACSLKSGPASAAEGTSSTQKARPQKKGKP